MLRLTVSIVKIKTAQPFRNFVGSYVTIIDIFIENNWSTVLDPSLDIHQVCTYIKK